jgi:hypothetical protein
MWLSTMQKSTQSSGGWHFCFGARYWLMDALGCQLVYPWPRIISFDEQRAVKNAAGFQATVSLSRSATWRLGECSAATKFFCSGPGEWLHCTPEPEQRCDGHRLALDRGRVNQWTCLHVATWRDYLWVHAFLVKILSHWRERSTDR